MIEIDRSVTGEDPAEGSAPAGTEAIGPEKREILWRLLESQNASIRFADAKAGASAGLALAAVGWAVSALGQSRRGDLAGPLGPALEVSVALLAVGSAATLGSALATILPRWGGLEGEKGPPGRLGFGEIASRSEAGYVRSLGRLALDQLGEALAADVWRLARICGRKYVWVSRTLWSSSLTVLAALVVLVVLAAMARGSGPAVPVAVRGGEAAPIASQRR